MSDALPFHTDTVLSKKMARLFQRLEDEVQLERPVSVYLAGGMAMHLYTADRYTTDIDAEFGARIFVPQNLTEQIDGTRDFLYFDTNYNPTFALMHEDYDQDAYDVNLGTRMFRVKVLSPLDLAVSKIARFAENDKEDIRTLAAMGLVSPAQLQKRGEEAFSCFVGNTKMLRINLDQAVEISRKNFPVKQSSTNAARRVSGPKST